ncbi:hypothetical protein LTR85_000505 [Meristemomyces frigidus]|nr:hypothetical protein LTR85_000505 [Meristemomyces frigidus]
MALHTQHIKKIGVVMERPEVFDQLVKLCVFCAEKILSFRQLILPRLGFAQHGFFEESALNLLYTVRSGDHCTESLINDLEAACWQSFRLTDTKDRLTSKDILFQQAVKLGATRLADCALRAQGISDQATSAHMKRFDALHWAVKEDLPDMVDLLLASGADIESQDAEGLRPLQLAIRAVNTTMVVHLLEKGALAIHADWTVNEGVLDLPLDSLSSLVSMSIQASTQTADSLAAKQILSAQNQDGNTLLHAAVRNGWTDLVQNLVHHGANLDSRNVLGETALHVGLRADCLTTECARAIVSAGARLDVADERGRTALDCAVRKGVADLVLLFLGAGAFLGLSGMHCGQEIRHGTMLTDRWYPLPNEILALYPADTDTVSEVAENSRLSELVRNALVGNCDLFSCLWYANADQNDAIRQCLSVLHSVAERQPEKAVSAMINIGVAVGAFDEQRPRGFDAEKYFAHTDMVHLLSKGGATLADSVDDKGSEASVVHAPNTAGLCTLSNSWPTEDATTEITTVLSRLLSVAVETWSQRNDTFVELGEDANAHIECSNPSLTFLQRALKATAWPINYTRWSPEMTVMMLRRRMTDVEGELVHSGCDTLRDLQRGVLHEIDIEEGETMQRDFWDSPPSE